MAALGWCSLEATASAAPRRGADIREGGYIYASPGPFAFPVDTDNFADLDITWQWSVGGGYKFNPAGGFMIALGGTIEHTIYHFENNDFGGIQFRFLPEVRIGGGNRRVWGYGLFGLGPGLSFVNDRDGDFDDTDGLLAVQFGGGVQGAVYRGLFLGGEFDVDAIFIFDGEGPDDADDPSMLILGPKFIIGWVF